ncbi:MAG: 50S ribosome-binding GTPase [Candidatus Eisenbacteria bacterium]|nr:50S ribosome-binding GTPase [Candidatus Eisenbacteria bacterium]
MKADTIAALATGRGSAALAVVRMSGADAIAILSQSFRRRAGERINPRLPRRTDPAHDDSFSSQPLGAHASAPTRLQADLFPSHRCMVGVFLDDRGPVDQVVVTLFRAPRSYTGEDVVEITSHGGSWTPGRILDRLLALGARPAMPGEFTQRAFLNGKLDLAQAEAVEALVRARSADAAQAALRVLRGGLRDALHERMNQLTLALALIEAGLDMEEDGAADTLALGLEEPSERETPDQILRSEILFLERLADNGRAERRAENGWRVVLHGRPNAGKSSILNALLARERAIVSPHPGTTRDTVEACVEWDGHTLVLVDTAGIEPEEPQPDAIASGPAGGDATERRAVEDDATESRAVESDATNGEAALARHVERGHRPAAADGITQAASDHTRRAIDSAALVVEVTDVQAQTPGELECDLASLAPGSPIVIALHKWDLEARSEWKEWLSRRGISALPGIETRERLDLPAHPQNSRVAAQHDSRLDDRRVLSRRDGESEAGGRVSCWVVASSAQSPPGTEPLRRAILAALAPDSEQAAEALLVSDRQAGKIEQALISLRAARRILQERGEYELAACELRGALDRLGEILGRSAGPRVLEEIFSRFCVGK